MRLSSVLSTYDLPLPELQAARLDGELFRVDECFSPIDEIEQRRHRGAAVAALVGPRLIAEQRTAAWIHGVLDAPPARHELCADVGARSRPASLARLLLREVVIDPEDIEELGGMRVTTPMRTVIDLCRFSVEFAEAEQEIVRGLMLVGGFGITECATLFDRRRNLPGKLAARERLVSILR